MENAAAIIITIAAMLLLFTVAIKSIIAFCDEEEAMEQENLDYCSTRGLKPWE